MKLHSLATSFLKVNCNSVTSFVISTHYYNLFDRKRAKEFYFQVHNEKKKTLWINTCFSTSTSVCLIPFFKPISSVSLHVTNQVQVYLLISDSKPPVVFWNSQPVLYVGDREVGRAVTLQPHGEPGRVSWKSALRCVGGKTLLRNSSVQNERKEGMREKVKEEERERDIERRRKRERRERGRKEKGGGIRKGALNPSESDWLSSYHLHSYWIQGHILTRHCLLLFTEFTSGSKHWRVFFLSGPNSPFTEHSNETSMSIPAQFVQVLR